MLVEDFTPGYKIWSCILKIKGFGYIGKVTQNVGKVRLMHLSRQNESRQNEM